MCIPAHHCSAALGLAGPKMAVGPEVPARWGAAVAGVKSGAAVKTGVVAPARPRFDSGLGAMRLPRSHRAGGAEICTARTEFSGGKTLRCVWGLQKQRSVVSIHGPLGYEPNTLTSAPLRWLQTSDRTVRWCFAK